MAAPSQPFWGPKLLGEAGECLAGQGWLPEAQHQCPAPVPALAGCEVQVSPLFKGVRGAQPRPVPLAQLCVRAQGRLFMVGSPRGAPLSSLHELICPPLTEILMILSNMTSGETWKSKTKYWRGEGPRPAVTWWAAANSLGLCWAPPSWQCLSAPRPFPLSPESDEQQCQPLVFPDPGAGGKPGPNRRARPQSLADWAASLGFLPF